jgi:hypothetical protein
MTAPTKEQTQRDLTALLELWATATPEARRVFAEASFSLDGWPAAVPISEAEVYDGKRWTRK